MCPGQYGLRVDFTIEFGGGPQDVTVTASGMADVAGFLRVNDKLKSDLRFRSDLAILYDFTELDMSRLSEGATEQVAGPITARDWDTPPGPVALIVSSPEARDWVRLAIAHLGGTKSGRRVFTSHEDALVWLGEQRAGA